MSLDQFHEVRLPLALAFGARGGPERRTEVVALASGGEARNSLWAGSRRRWELGGAVTKLSLLNELIEFFEARRGRFHGFRFRDVFDDRSARPGQAISALDQLIGAGDGVQTRFQLTKTYGETARVILKPVIGSVHVALDGTEIDTGVNVDYTTGEVAFSQPPQAGVEIRAGFHFDCPVRFDSDRLETSLEAYGAGRATGVQIVELLG